MPIEFIDTRFVGGTLSVEKSLWASLALGRTQITELRGRLAFMRPSVVECARFLHRLRVGGLDASVTISLYSESKERAEHIDDPFSGWELWIGFPFVKGQGPDNRIAVTLKGAEWKEKLPSTIGFVHYDDIKEFESE
jgi:hypothetical protein